MIRSNEEIKDRVLDMDIYEQTLMDFRKTINTINGIIGKESKLHETKIWFLSFYLKSLKTIEQDLFEYAYRMGIPAYQVKLDIEDVMKGGRFRYVSNIFRKDNENEGNENDYEVPLRKRRTNKIKSKRKICKCKR